MPDYAEPTSGSEPKRLTIKELPEDERPRERLLQKGADTLTDAELLAIIIRDGTRKESALDLARRMLHQFGSLRDLRDRTIAELCGIKGIGPARAAQVKAALALANRIGENQLRRGQRFTSSKAVFDSLYPRLRYLKQECFFCLLLDVKNRILREVEISRGGLSVALVNPREVLQAAVAESASAMILLHNHPSGDPEPSADDITLTRRIKEACELTGIRLLDHIVVGEEGYVSLADRGRV